MTNVNIISEETMGDENVPVRMGRKLPFVIYGGYSDADCKLMRHYLVDILGFNSDNFVSASNIIDFNAAYSKYKSQGDLIVLAYPIMSVTTNDLSVYNIFRPVSKFNIHAFLARAQRKGAKVAVMVPIGYDINSHPEIPRIYVGIREDQATVPTGLVKFLFE